MHHDDPPRWIGRSLRRFEDRRLLTGAGHYSGDVALPGALALGIYRSPYPHAQLTALDVSAARRAPGVVDILVGSDVLGLGNVELAPFVPNVKNPPHPLLVATVARYAGEPVAAILAESPGQARDAIDLIEAAWAPLPVVSTAEEALVDQAPRLHPSLASNVAFEIVLGSTEEEVEAAFAAADHVFSLRLVSPRVCAVPIEPRSLAVEYQADQDRFLLHPAQHGSGMPANVETALGLPAKLFDVLAQDVGGGFGSRSSAYREDLLAVYLAHKHRRSVRWTATRSEDFLTMTGGRDQTTYADGAFRRDGRLLALRVRNLGNLGAYVYAVTALIPAAVPRLITGAYDIPVARGVSTGVLTNRVPTAPYRGAGRPESTLITERLMDTAARELGLDPLEIRRLNFIRPESFPYTTPTGNVYDSGDYEKTLDHALSMADYPALLRRCVAARARGELFGIGVCTFVEPAGGGMESGRVRVAADGSVVLESGAFSYGQGHQTAYAQVIAEELGVEPTLVTVVEGDSRRVPPGVGTFGSRSMTTAGGAAKIAAGHVLEHMKRLAGHLLEVEPTDIAWDGRTFHPTGVPARGLTWAMVAEAAHDPARLPADVEPGLVSNERYVPPGTWPHGTHIAAVSIDRETGRITVEQFVAVDDAGVIVNPLLAEAQVMGGLAQGFGQALFEQVVYDDTGMPVSGSLGDYALPRATDLPAFVLGETCTPAPGNVLGVKGIGESGTVGAPPALVNAVLDALNAAGAHVQHVDFPLTSETVWRALQRGAA